MMKLSAVIILAMLMASTYMADADRESRDKRDIQIMTLDQFLQMICQNFGSKSPICSAYTTTTTTTTTTSQSTTQGAGIPLSTQPDTTASTTVAATSTTSLSGSALERAHWCQFSNGSYLSLLQTFMYNDCDICQCTQAHTIQCTKLQCMTTYCIDGSIPATRSGQCCSQCSYDQDPSMCVVNGISFPHGKFNINFRIVFF